jgi:aspartyl protease family protein
MVHTVRNLIFVLLAVMGVAVLLRGTGGEDQRREARTGTLPQSEPQAAAARPAAAANQAVPANQIVLRPGRGGHYYVTADVGGAEVRFLVDTGASLIALSADDAERIGLDPESLDYNGVVQTANGTTRVAPITLDEVRIGQMEVDRVEAIVSRAPMGMSLLGMSFLRRLDGYRVEDGNLVLYW